MVFKKACPIARAVQWWSRILDGDVSIDVKSIAGRSASSFEENWEEAMKVFKAKVANKKPIAID